jgi:hypothetical protein
VRAETTFRASQIILAPKTTTTALARSGQSRRVVGDQHGRHGFKEKERRGEGGGTEFDEIGQGVEIVVTLGLASIVDSLDWNC